MQELEELRLEACENSQIYKEKVKRFHDNRILRKEVRVGQKIIADGPFVVTNIFPYDVVEVRDEANNLTFEVNGHQLKPYHERAFSTESKPTPVPCLKLSPCRLHLSLSFASITPSSTGQAELTRVNKRSLSRDEVILASPTPSRPNQSRLGSPCLAAQQPSKEWPNCIDHISYPARRPPQRQLNCHVTLKESATSRWKIFIGIE
ncbi:hypothetical protein CR513_55599, partial [Mucuna pruriens]